MIENDLKKKLWKENFGKKLEKKKILVENVETIVEKKCWKKNLDEIEF